MIFTINFPNSVKAKVEASDYGLSIISAVDKNGNAIDPDEIQVIALTCDVCGSSDLSETPHYGINCNWCHPLG